MQNRSLSRRTIAALLAVGLLAAGCGSDSGGGSGASDGSPSAAADRLEVLDGDSPEPSLPVEVESADGATVTVDSAERIIPLSGSLAEIVYTLGLGERVVARDVTATFEEAEELPVVTRGHEVSAESVLSLDPDVVLIEDTTGPGEAVDQIRAAGIPLVVFETPTELAAVPERITAIAGTLGVTEAGERLVDRTDTRLTEAMADLPEDGDQPRVAFLYLRGSASVYLLGGLGSGATSLIEAAGAIDAGAESGLEKDFTPITSEALAAAAPDVILVMSKGLESVGGVDGLLEIPGIAETPAGMDRRVASVDDGVLLNYGPRTHEVLSQLATQIHAEGAGSA